MASPFKRLCTCPAISRSYNLQQQCRAISSSTSSKATPSESTTDLDALTSHPGVTYTTSLSPDNPADFIHVKNTELSSRAHRELAQHRELRQLVRVAAWEMPLLSTLHKPYTPPSSQQILRWRYTTYLGEPHPAARKVIVEFDPSRLPNLTPAQLSTLLKLAGPRYDPTKQQIKMSSESFESQAQNKRYLADTISKLITAAREGDTFADVPLDTRHVKEKKKHKFPAEWALTPERKAELEAGRRKALVEDGRRIEKGKMVSGLQAIEEARKVDSRASEEPVMVEAKRGMVRGKAGPRQMGAGGRAR